MDGRFLPPFDELFAASPWFANFFENVTLIQLDHRLLAYLVLAVALGNAAIWLGRGRDRAATKLAVILAILVLAQTGLGIATLLLAVPLALALAHQLFATLVLTASVRLATLCGGPRVPMPAETPYGGESPLAAHVATR
jgi:cytochrome c oxidase assembly protein subunit 15